MQTFNRFGEPVHVVDFTSRDDARHFTKMLGCNASRFALVGTHRTAGGWQVIYRSRKASPWQRDPRAKGVA